MQYLKFLAVYKEVAKLQQEYKKQNERVQQFQKIFNEVPKKQTEQTAIFISNSSFISI